MSVFGIQPERRAAHPARAPVDRGDGGVLCQDGPCRTTRRALPAGRHVRGRAHRLRDGAPVDRPQAMAVERVLMMDSAMPHAERRNHVTAQRSSRLREAVAAARQGRGAARRRRRRARASSRARSSASCRTRSTSGGCRRAIAQRWTRCAGCWPTAANGRPSLPSLDFRAIYNHAEDAYRPAPSPDPGLLIRATQGSRRRHARTCRSSRIPAWAGRRSSSRPRRRRRRRRPCQHAAGAAGGLAGRGDPAACRRAAHARRRHERRACRRRPGEPSARLASSSSATSRRR